MNYEKIKYDWKDAHWRGGHGIDSMWNSKAKLRNWEWIID